MAKGITVPVVQSGLEASIEAAAKKAGPLTLSATVDPSSFKRLAQPLGRVSGLATEFEKSIAASNARVIAFGASVGIINGVQNAFASLVKTTIDVEKSLTNIAVISGKTTDELQPFSRALFEIAKNTAQSFQTASEAALEFSRQGLSLDETLKRTQDALTLTRFTTLSAAEAVDVLTAAANSFGATGITTSEILNKLVAVDTKFAVSAEDLAKGLSRAGSIAQEVGVNFDELNAIVTIAQERTARGGAVIGNAFKTIFTRIRSDETIQALQSIGIYSFDAEGRLKPVVGLLEELAGKINTLGETKRIEVLEAIASKYNINVLTALVDDLGSTASKFREARDVSAGAQSEAYQRQIELNQTLDAVITRVTNSAAQLADTLGRIGVTDSLKSLLNFFDNILTGINDVIDSEGIGGTIAKGLISGLSGVFFKIGIPLLLAIFVKLTRDIAQFGVESLKTILGINKEVRERQALEQAVVNTLIKDQQVMATILSLSGDRRKQEEYLLSVYNRQLAALQQVQSIAANVAPALQAAGLSATSGTVKKRAAGGYLPAEEAKDVRRGVGGASPSSKVVEIPNFSFGGGKRGTMVANTSEYIVPNYANGSGTAIFNQDMVKQYGLPPGAKKITASGGFIPASGFVPNFAEAKFNIQNPRKRVAKENESKSVITNIDLDNMLPSAYLTISNNPDTSPVGVFSSLQEAAKQKLQEKLGQPIDPSARVEGENIEIKKIQNSYASGGQLIGSVIDAQRKIQSGKANVKKESEVIVNRIIPETSGPLDDNLRKTLVARVENEIKTANSPFFAAGNILEDVLFASTEGDLQDRNSRSWDLPKNISPNFKKAFNLKSDFADVKLGKTERSMSSFLGKHIMAPSGTNASRGYIPNFARYVYDADRVDADKNNLLKAILASRVKKNLIVGPAGSGKSTYGESLGSFITNIAQLSDASEIDILSGAARTKDGGVSKNFQQISDAVNASGGKISYLYTGNMDILSRRTGRIAEGPKQGDLRSKKQIAGSMFAPLNQFDFISKVKGSAKNFEMIRGAKGYVPNFADKKPATIKGGKVDRKTYTGSRAIVSAEGIAGMIVPDQANQKTMTDYLRENPWGFQTKEDVYLPPDNSLITNVRYNTYGLNEQAFEGQALKKSGTQTLIEADVEKAGIEIAKKWATKYSDEYAKKMPGRSVKTNYDENFIRTSFTASEGAVSAISTLGGGIFESSIRAALDTQVGQRIEKAQKEDSNNRLDFPVNPFLKELFGIGGGEQFVDAKISGSPGSTGRKLADQIVAAGLYKTQRVINTKSAAEGYVPNFAEIKKQQELLAPSGQFYDLDTADKFLAASNVSLEAPSTGEKGLGQQLKQRILASAKKVYGAQAQIGISRLPGRREAFTSAVLNNPALADDFIALQKATTGGIGPVANTPEALAKFNNPTPFDPTPWPAVRAVGGKTRAVKKVGPMSLTAAFGYVPNFAENEPLKEAISREMGAGVPAARVRVTQDGRLKNPKNPNGLAVINTRDEPNGKIPNDFRERGMRAAMASRGFVPNFADDAPRVKFAKPEKMEVAEYDDLKIAINEEIKSLKKGSITREQLSQKTKELADAYRLSEENSKKFNKAVETAAQKAQGGGGGGGSGGGGNKNIDIGKFLLLQTVVTGLTSAIQSFTEQGSTASNVLEGVNAGLSGTITALTLASSLSPPLRIAIGAVTALASASGLLARLYEESKSESQKTAEALARLGQEATKAGKRLSAEEYLSAFDAAVKKKEEEKDTNEAEARVREAFSKTSSGERIVGSGFLGALADDEIQPILAALSAAGKIEKGGNINPEVLKQLRESSFSDGTRIQGAKDFDQEKAIKAGKELVLANRAASLKTVEQETKTAKVLESENTILKLGITLRQNIFNAELNIIKLQAQRARDLEQQNILLERQKDILTETQFAQAERATAVRGAQQERAKAQESSRLDLTRGLQSVKEGGLGNVLGALDQNEIATLQTAFQTGGGALSDQFKEALKTVTTGKTKDGKGIEFQSLAQQSRTDLQTIFETDAKATGVAEQNYNDQLASITQKFALFETEVQKINRRTGALNEQLQETEQGSLKFNEKLNIAQAQLKESTAQQLVTSKIQVAMAGEKLKSEAELLNAETRVIEAENAYAEELGNTERIVALRASMLAKLEQSERKAEEETQASIQIIGQKIQADIAAIQRQTRLANAEEDAYDETVKKTRLTALVNDELAKLRKQLRQQEEERGVQTNEEVVRGKRNVELGAISTQRDIIEAENKLFDANEDLTKRTFDLSAYRLGLGLATQKAIKTERDAETENEIAIQRVKQNYQADINSTKRKLEYAQALLGQIHQAEINEKVVAEMNLEGANLALAFKEAKARLANVGIEVGNEAAKIKTASVQEITSSIAKGEALSRLGISAEFESQAAAVNKRERMAGRNPDEIGAAEMYDISKGRNQTITQNLREQSGALLDQAQSFQDIIGKSAPKLFADGMAEAMQVALNQADNLGEALNGIAMSFLKSLQSAFLQSASQQIVASVLPSPIGKAKGGYIKGYASGGLVTGGSGYKDDVPAMLSQGEYVIRKSSVEKYGAHNLQKLNSGEPPKFASGGIFLPGVRGGTAISGYKDLTAFANQTTTSGATDILSGGQSSAFVSLEDQSKRLSAYALMNQDDTINQEIRSAQEQARNVIAEREAYRTAERKAFQKQLVGTVASAALSFGVGKLSSALFAPKAGAPVPLSDKASMQAITDNIGSGTGNMLTGMGDKLIPSLAANNPVGDLSKNLSSNISYNNPSLGGSGVSLGQALSPKTGRNFNLSGQSNYSYPTSLFSTGQYGPSGFNILQLLGTTPRGAYGGMIARYANGGTPTDKIPALVMGGEYIMSDKATKKYGKKFFDSINQGRAPRFADGGQVSTAEPSFAEKAASSSDSKATGATNVSININVTGGTSDTQTQGDTKQGGVDYKKMSEQIKQVVIQTINEEKRLGGSLRPRG